jgi:hypothetical protein
MEMKISYLTSVALLSTLLLTNGCVGLSVGGGSKSESKKPTVGQQLIDLQRARDSGAITEEQYQTQKAKLLNQ